ncbi:MAG: M14 family zinc carboxypeptidase [Planctomycetota bacterium]
MRTQRPLTVLGALVLLLFAPAVAAQTSTTNPPVRGLVEVIVTGPAQMRQLMAMDLDLAGCQVPLPAQRRIEVVTIPGDLARLEQAGLRCRVLVQDLAAAHAAALAAWPTVTPDTLTPAIGQGSMGGHYTLAEMEASLDAFHIQYPQLCSQKVSIGTSIQGRPLWMVKISDNVGVDENEPEVYYDALHHAREPLSLGATLLFMDELLSGYGSDPEATFLIDERELWFVPCVNPDGYEYNRSTNPNGGGLWRKNRRLNSGGSYGVDLNRNYATAWNAPNGGSSPSQTSETYRGTAPFSEPETQVIEAFAASRQFVQVFTTHTYTDVLLRPFGYVLADPTNAATYDAVGAQLVQDNGVAQGRLSSLLYIASGSSVDHHHTVRGSLTFSAELGRSNEGGFWPVGPKIEEIARRHQSMFRRFALTAGPAFQFVDVTITEGPGANNNGVVEPGESGQVTAVVQNLGISPAPLTLTLLAVDPGIVVGTGTLSLGTVGALGSSTNTGTPLTFTLAPGFLGSIAHLVLQATGDGRVSPRQLEVPTSATRRCVDDDFELGRGFARGLNTATTGLWERAIPLATTSQPGSQTTPGGTLCWVTDGRSGASADTYDVDAGYTDLLSPVFDLQHLAAVEASFDLWYAETAANDPLLVQLSRDGGAHWTTLLSRSTPTVGWQRVVLALPAPLTNTMVLRIRVQDQFESTVEALVDQFELRGVAGNGAVTLLGSGALGSSLRVGMSGPDGSIVVPFGALGLSAGNTIPGIGGSLLLDPITLVLLAPQLMGPTAYAAIDVSVPNQPGLVGVQIAFQSAWLTATAISFGSNTASATLH